MQNEMPIRLIATDIDGTLLNDKGIIPPENIAAIREAQEKGITVAIASGRYVENVYMLLQEYGLSCHIIGVNGARITDRNLQVMSQHFMDPQVVLKVHDTIRSFGANYFIFGPDHICTGREADKHHSELAYGKGIEKLGFHFYHGQEEADRCCQGPVYKFFVCDNVPLPPIREALKNIDGIELTQSSPRNIEIMPVGVDKAQGIRDLANVLGISLSQVMTLGDEANDIPMLQAAGYGVAMGNGSQAAKDAARFVTDANYEGGWANAVRKYALSFE